jgi:hypothetical protein
MLPKNSAFQHKTSAGKQRNFPSTILRILQIPNAATLVSATQYTTSSKNSLRHLTIRWWPRTKIGAIQPPDSSNGVFEKTLLHSSSRIHHHVDGSHPSAGRSSETFRCVIFLYNVLSTPTVRPDLYNYRRRGPNSASEQTGVLLLFFFSFFSSHSSFFFTFLRSCVLGCSDSCVFATSFQLLKL